MMNKIIFVMTILLGVISYFLFIQFDFYKSKKNGDLWRFPLLEPFELISPTKDDWFLKLKDYNPYSFKLKIPYQVSYIDSIGVLKEKIFIHSKKADFPGGSRPAWFIVEIINQDSFKIEAFTNNEFNKGNIKEGLGAVALCPR